MWSLQATIVAGGFACLVPLCIYADPRSRLSRVVCWKPAIQAGLISYAFYVFHQPLLFLVVRAWHLDAQDFPAVAGSHVIGLLVVGVVVAGITALLSVASWRLFEQPILKLKARF
jgi:peptidoglycan/LPS O-acetylase OafA/YrhL